MFRVLLDPESTESCGYLVIEGVLLTVKEGVSELDCCCG